MDAAILSLTVLCAILAVCLVVVTLLAFGLAKAALGPLLLGAEERVLAPRRGAAPSLPPPDYDDRPTPQAPPRPKVTTSPPPPASLWSEVPGNTDPFKGN